MNTHDEERMKQLLREALPPIGTGGLDRDLWPMMQRRIEQRPTAPWFDWALAGGLTVFLVVFPTIIPVFLYCL